MSLYKRPGSRFWWTKFEHAGEPYRRSTGESDRRKAEKAARRIRVEIEQAAGPGGRQVGLALEVLEGLDEKRARDIGCGQRQIDTIGERWTPLLRLLGAHTDVMALTNATPLDYQGKRRREGVRGQTIRREVQALRRGVELAEANGLIPYSTIKWSLVAKIPSDPPLESQQSKEWSARDVRKVLAKLSSQAMRYAVQDVLRFAQLTGLRYEELRRYRRTSWVNGRVLRVPAVDGAKTRENGARTIYLGAEAARIAKRHELFAIGKIARTLKLASQKAGMPCVLTLRDLRAHYITEVAKIDPLAAQKLAGHKNIATTSRYLHLDKASTRRAALKAAAQIERVRRA